MPFPTDPFSAATHLLGAIACGLGAWPLLRRGRGLPGRQLALGVFVGSAITLLLASTLFHAMPMHTVSRTVAQRLDHAAIFLLIAGTFTPIQIVLFRGRWRWGVLVFIWTSALAGVVVKSVFFRSVPEHVGIAAYLALGWTGGISIVAILVRRGLRFVFPLLLGGLAYTAGAVCEFTSLPVPWPGIIGSHEVFHVAVLVGLGSMWLFVHRIAGITAFPSSVPVGPVHPSSQLEAKSSVDADSPDAVARVAPVLAGIAASDAPD